MNLDHWIRITFLFLNPSRHLFRPTPSCAAPPYSSDPFASAAISGSRPLYSRSPSPSKSPMVLLPGIAAGPPSSIGLRDTLGKQGSREKGSGEIRKGVAVERLGSQISFKFFQIVCDFPYKSPANSRWTWIFQSSGSIELYRTVVMSY